MDKVKSGRQPLYFGWYVLATTILIGIVTTGAQSSSGIFVVPMEKEFGWDRFTVTLAVSLGALVNGVAQPFMGRAFDVVGARKVIIVSLFVYGLAIVLVSLTFHLLFLVFILGFISPFALSGTSLTNTGALVAKWFRRKRATMVGFNSAGLSLGGLLLVPFAMYLLQATSWRIAWAALGLIILVLALPMALLFIRDEPAKLGLQTDGDEEPPDDVTGETAGRRIGPLEVDEPGRGARSLRSWPMWQMSGSYAVCGFTTTMLSVHFVPYAIDQGIASSTAATIFGFMMGLNILGTIGAGMLADRIGGRKNMLALVYLLRGGAYVLLLLVPSTMGLWAFGCPCRFFLGGHGVPNHHADCRRLRTAGAGYHIRVVPAHAPDRGFGRNSVRRVASRPYRLLHLALRHRRRPFVSGGSLGLQHQRAAIFHPVSGNGAGSGR